MANKNSLEKIGPVVKSRFEFFIAAVDILFSFLLSVVSVLLHYTIFLLTFAVSLQVKIFIFFNFLSFCKANRRRTIYAIEARVQEIEYDAISGMANKNSQRR